MNDKPKTRQYLQQNQLDRIQKKLKSKYLQEEWQREHHNKIWRAIFAISKQVKNKK